MTLDIEAIKARADKATAMGTLDAHIAASMDVPALFAALEDSETARVKAEQERDEYRAKLMNLADAPSVKGMSWNGFNVIGDDKSIAAVQSAVHYGGQIDEYRAAFLQRKAALEAERDALKKALKPFADAKIPETVMGQYIKISTMTVAFNGEHDITPSAFKIARRALEAKREEPVAGEHQEVLDAINACITGEE